MQTQLVINGARCDGSDGDTFPVLDPATTDTIAEVASGTRADMIAACDAAAAAQPGWAATPPRERSELLRRCFEKMLEHKDALADLIVLENGKPKADALGEIAYAAEFFRWNAEETVRIHGSIGLNPAGTARMIVHHPPVGVVLLVAPWNFPAAMITRKLAPALGAGNTVVIKPPSDTPLTALALADLFENTVGIPPGVINMVTSASAGAVVDAGLSHDAVRMLSFTGSTEVGRVLLAEASNRVLKTVMELGGNAPFVVFDDADLDVAIPGAIAAKMRHSAETCTAANRFFVQSGIADEFADRLADAMGAMQVSNGFAEGAEVGPLISEKARANVGQLVTDAVADGAKIRTGGHQLDAPGYFYAPTVLSNVAPDARITHEEIFGPVAPLITFDDTDTMIAQANNTEMGLMGYVFTQDLARGLAVSERIQAGMIGLNRGVVSDPAAPFGGMKQSGIGREGATHGIYEFCETQYIATNW